MLYKIGELMDLFGKSPRPQWDKARRALAAIRMADQVLKYNEIRLYTREQLIIDLIEVMFSYDDDGFAIGKELDDKGYDITAAIIEDLDCATHIKSEVLDAAVKAWVISDKIEPERKVGDMVHVEYGGKTIPAEITKLYPEEAQYGVWIPGVSTGEKSKSHYLYNYEKTKH